MAENAYKFKRNIDIGALNAEDDKLLMKAFVDKQDLSLLKANDDPKCILLGRTGSGKSALIRYLEETEQQIARINPESMSLRHLSNSDIINYFSNLNVKLDLFYKVLWKHVFIVELIKLHFNNNVSKPKGVLEWVREQLPNKTRKASIDYLKNWENKFWEDTEYRIRELETSLENRFKGEFGGNLGLNEIIALSTKSESEHKNSQTIKYDVINKAQKVINESQIEHIKNIIEMMEAELFNKSQKKYFLVIDDLDTEWVSETIVYDLIKSLIETIKDLSKIPNVKIIIALRTNIHKKIFKENMSRGVQREKYDHLYLHVKWNKDELENLLNNRLGELMRGHYTSQSPTINDILPQQTKNQSSSFDYMIERTFLRPRDIIDFFNKCIKNADGQTHITREMVFKAEDEYSHERLRALNDEWLENYGDIHTLYNFLKGTRSGFKIKEIKEKAEEYFINLLGSEHLNRLNKGWEQRFGQYENDCDTNKLLAEILVLLYQIGLIGIKTGADKRNEYVYESYSSIEIEDLNENSKFYVHPMFRKALRIQD